ncbi:hypothetical protein ACF1BQ_011495 [Bradyrhizobium sp. RDT10]
MARLRQLNNGEAAAAQRESQTRPRIQKAAGLIAATERNPHHRDSSLKTRRERIECVVAHFT